MRVTTYEPIRDDALVEQGVDGSYVKVEHFDRLLIAMNNIDQVMASNVSASGKFALVTSILDQHREFVQDNQLFKPGQPAANGNTTS